MKKTAPAEFPIQPLIAERWSPYAFSAQPVETEKLHSVFEAARWAASSSNEQPWSFVIAFHGTPEFDAMAGCLLEFNAWAKGAAVLGLTVARVSTFAGKPNRTAFYDTGMAAANLILQATAEGLFVHQMGGYDIEKARATLKLPENHEPIAMFAMGYYGDASTLPDKLRDREAKSRERKPTAQFVFTGTWGSL